MKKILMMVVAGVVALTAVIVVGCSSDDPCKEYNQKVMDCLKATCSGKSNCSTCSCVDQGCCPGYACTTNESSCEGALRDNAEQELSGFSCDTNNAAKTAEAWCP